MVTLLAIKAFLQFWGVKALAFLETIPYKRHILLGVVVLLLFLGAVRYCSRQNVPDFTIQSGSEEIERNEKEARKQLEETIRRLDQIKAEQDARIRELERLVEQARGNRNVTAEQLEKKARGK
jgi:hypothetical protein